MALHCHMVSYVVILILANFHEIMKVIFTKINFHLKSVLQKFYTTKIWSYTVWPTNDEDFYVMMSLIFADMYVLKYSCMAIHL